MSDNKEFASTLSGKKFLEKDMPRLVIVLEKLANALLESNKIEEKKLLIEQKRYLNEKKNA
tara:strand:+ start:1027 stop:1209 length:183 start_codon:yes stop_codon:yes gene_type:complete